MPYVKKTRKRSNRRKKRSKKQNYLFRLQRQMPVGFPKTNAVKLRYVTSTILDAAPGAIASVAYRANSCFDPSFAIGGHQPNGFDQWSQFYNHYVVVGSRLKVTMAMTGTTPSGGILLGGVFLSDDTTHSATVSTLMEQSQYRGKKAYYSLSGNRPTTISKGFSTKKFFNVTNITDNWARLGAQITADPSEQAFFIVFTGNPNGSIDAPELSILVEIEYICIFSEPKELPQS